MLLGREVQLTTRILHFEAPLRYHLRSDPKTVKPCKTSTTSVDQATYDKSDTAALVSDCNYLFLLLGIPRFVRFVPPTTMEWAPTGRARGTHFVSLRLRCAPLRATPRRLPFARNPIPSEGPRPEAVARVEGSWVKDLMPHSRRRFFHNNP